jgi:hypothetical protein
MKDILNFINGEYVSNAAASGTSAARSTIP